MLGAFVDFTDWTDGVSGGSLVSSSSLFLADNYVGAFSLLAESCRELGTIPLNPLGLCLSANFC